MKKCFKMSKLEETILKKNKVLYYNAERNLAKALKCVWFKQG